MAPRSAEATPAMSRPATSVGSAPRRAMKSDPGSAATAKRIMGRPERMPTSVPERRRSDWISAMTGGTARMLSRSATPASQSRPPAIQSSRMALPAAGSFSWSCAGRSAAMTTFYSRSAFQALERLVDLEPAPLGFFALLALTLDHILRRAGDEIGIGEFGIDAVDVGFDPRHLFLQPRFLGGKIDHALERQRRDLPAHDQLHRALRRAL